MVAYSRLTPLIIVTGFLGSGKTTLLNRMLRDPSLKDAAVLVNEFGDVGLDHFLVEKMDENTVLLASGCLCCTIRDDLKQAIIELNGKRERGEVPYFKRMIIETTGLADPSPIIFTLNSDIIIKHHYRLGSIITTVDAVNGLAQLKRHGESVKQASVADRIVLTKTDIAEPADAARLRAKLERLNPSAQLIEAVDGEVDVKQLLRADIYDPRTKGAEVRRWLAAEEKIAAPHGHGPDVNRHDVNRHDEHIHTFTLTFDTPLDWTAFGIWLTMLLHAHGEKVLRVKGILNVKGVEAPVVINGVQHVVHPPMHLKAWPDGDRRSRIVFIVDDIEQELIERSLAAFNAAAAKDVAAA
jgi:G3E family GTPase